ncbi:uncharacterized protein LOC124636326 [Helicoverpa zea]|uniref:uncharacterized protein LOC124636326 n=1 Tax=Helicoverpa zea TaxID=7113 RepID=UPI001F597113|nr:uncharacterized protein LOC124636326 [Helicoverpa zea]
MYSPKIRPAGSYIESKSADEGNPCLNIRYFLLAWGFLRLVCSLLWTGLIIMSTIWTIGNEDKKERYYIDTKYLIPQEFISIAIQVVEVMMIVTFIVAGFKKSVELYRAYYRYCLVTFGIYIAVVVLIMVLGYDSGHYFAEVYLTYHIADFCQIFGYIIRDLAKPFFVVSAIDILLEVLLIRLVKKMVIRYEEENDAETV